MSDIAAWLENLGLGKYAAVFAKNEIDRAVLPDLTEQDLKDLALPIGPRRKLLKAIAALAADALGDDTVELSAVAPQAERRQLTVMFVDLVGSTELSGRLDPEDMRGVIIAYQNAVAGEIGRFEGHVAKFMGDGVLAYFGWPRAHEDAAERAVRAALAASVAVGKLRTPAKQALSARIGIATGLVVVGDLIGEGAAQEQAVVGETPNLAARLQGLAKPGAVVISESNRRLLGEVFELQALGPQTLKGIADPVAAYQVMAERQGQGRFEALRSAGISPLAGREQELELLLKHWALASGRPAQGQAVLLGGEPGIGKSRLSQELSQRIGAGEVLRFQCSPYRTGSAFHPFIEQLQRAAEFHPDDTVPARQEKLETLVQRTVPEHESARTLLAELLSLPTDTYPPLAMSREKQKAETIRLLVLQLVHRAETEPLLMLFEDAHWSDPSSLEVLTALIGQVPSLALLLLITHRPEFAPPWADAGQVNTLSLERLGCQALGGLVESVSGGETLPVAVREQIVARADGMPLYAEELTRAVLEAESGGHSSGVTAGSPGAHRFAVPSTLQDSLMARLDRLESAKEVAQTAACIGREFSAELLAAVSPLSRAALDQALQQLLGAQIVFSGGAEESDRYFFKHALLRDAAYESQLLARRREIHATIARVLEERFPQAVNTEPELLARHYSTAERADRAIPYWLAAGRRALSRSSPAEAVAHLSEALELTAALTDPGERAEAEQEVRTVLGAATSALHGWPAPEVRTVVQPACALYEHGYGGSDAFSNFWTLWVHHGCRAEHREGLAVVERMLEHAGRRREPVLTLVASFTAAMAYLWAGDYEKARAHERTALEFYDFERDKDLVWHYNHDPKNTLLSWGALRVWALGFPDWARSLSDQAVAHARRVGHPWNLCWTLGNSSITYANCGGYEVAYGRVEELRRIAEEQELLFMTAYMVPGILAQIAAQEGDYETACERGAQAEQVWHSVGGRFWSPVVKAHMAQACLHLGRHDEGLELIDQALEQAESSGELMCVEELYRVAGQVRLGQKGGRDQALQLFGKSLAYSKRHGTRSYKLRTALSIALVLREQGRSREARELLAAAHKEFTEGFDCADLKAAKVLLDELA